MNEMGQFWKFKVLWHLNGQNLIFADFRLTKLAWFTILKGQNYNFEQFCCVKINFLGKILFSNCTKLYFKETLVTVSTLFECIFHSSCVFIYSCAMSSAIISFSDNLERIFCGLLVHVTTTIFISCSLVIKANIVLNDCWFWSLTRNWKR